MGKKTWGGYFPEQSPYADPSSGYYGPNSYSGVIPGVFYVDDVRLFLDGASYVSTIDPSGRDVIYPPTNRECYGITPSWPRSLFTIDAQYPKNAAVACNTEFIDFEMLANVPSPDYGYGFKIYWEKQLPGTTTWIPVVSPVSLITTKIRLGGPLHADTIENALGQYSTLRYSAANLYGTGQTITIPATNNTPTNDTIVLMVFNETTGTSVGPVLVGGGRVTPTVTTLGSPTLITTNPPPAFSRSLSITQEYAAQSVTLTADSFSRSTDDFTLELYFRWQGHGYDPSPSDENVGTIVDTRMNSADVLEAKNPDALAIQVRSKRLTVLRGESRVINDREDLPQNVWYHIILTCENGVLRLYKRPLPAGGVPMNTAYLCGSYSGDHVGVLRIRGDDLALDKNGTKYKALVKYGALRELPGAREAVLEVVTPAITEWIIKLDLLLVGAGDIFNQRHLLDQSGTGYPAGAGHEIRLDVEIESTVASNQFKFGWEIATQILSDTLDPARELFFIGSPAAGGGGYDDQQVYDWIDGEALAVTGGLTPEEYWAGATSTNPAAPIVPELSWSLRRAPQANPEIPAFVAFEGNTGANFLAYRPFAMCGTQKIIGPIAFVERATT